MTTGFAPKGGRSAEEICHGTAPLMPKATAVWLVENTALSFDQIADFCKLHPLEVKAIADGDAAQGIKGLDPVLTGQLTREEIEKARGRSEPRRLKLPTPRCACPRPRRRRARATRRCRAGRTGRTRSCGWCAIIPSSRTRRSCGSSAPPSRPSRRSASAPTGTPRNLQPMDPVTLGLCSQIDLDLEVQRAAKEKPVDVEARARRCCRRRKPPPRREPEAGRRRSPPTSSTSMPCSPSSSRSAARASSAAPAAIQPYGITPARTSSRRTRARAAAGGSARYTSAQSRTPAQGRGSGRARPPRG